MQKYRKPKFTEADLGTNPLTNALSIPIRRVAMNGQFYRAAEDDAWLNNVADLEATRITKVFVSAERRLIYAKLTPRAKELWGWLQYELEPGKDYLWINRVRFMEEVTVRAINTYAEAVRQLVRYGFICHSLVSGVYWINPDFMFLGNRQRKYPEKVTTTTL